MLQTSDVTMITSNPNTQSLTSQMHKQIRYISSSHLPRYLKHNILLPLNSNCNMSGHPKHQHIVEMHVWAR